VVKWQEAGILSQQSRFDSRQGKPQKIKAKKASLMIKFARHSIRKNICNDFESSAFFCRLRFHLTSLSVLVPTIKITVFGPIFEVNNSIGYIVGFIGTF